MPSPLKQFTKRINRTRLAAALTSLLVASTGLTAAIADEVDSNTGQAIDRGGQRRVILAAALGLCLLAGGALALHRRRLALGAVLLALAGLLVAGEGWTARLLMDRSSTTPKPLPDTACCPWRRRPARAR